MQQTMAQYHLAEGRAEGRAEGIQIGQIHGIEIGQVRAMRRTLLNILTIRFGDVPLFVSQAVESAETEQLEKWVTEAATAVSLESVGIITQP